VPDQASIVRGCLPIHRVLFAAIDLRLWVWDGNWFGDGIIFFWWGLFFGWWLYSLQFGLQMIVHRFFWLLDVVSVGSHRMREVELFLVSLFFAPPTGLRHRT